MTWRCHILTLFPEFFESPLNTSIVGRAVAAEQLDVVVHDIRKQTHDKHRTADDTPYGGGAGMVMKAEPIVETIEVVEADDGRLHRVLMTPQGNRFDQAAARRLSSLDGILLICGRYEGVDERVRTGWVDEELSIGDYVLTGGEPAALVVLDAVIRLRPGVLGNAESSEDESFADGLLEYPQYTRPYDFRGMTVPDVLRSGDHGKVAEWRRAQSVVRTLEKRPDLLVELRTRLTDTDRETIRAADPDWFARHLAKAISEKD